MDYLLPLFSYDNISQLQYLLSALFIGLAFGLVLEQGGLGNAQKLANQFLLKDLTVLKVMFTAIITAMLGLVILSRLGYLNLQLIAFPDSYLLPQAAGGLLLGAGFAIAGYCPGTTLVGMACGKLDAFTSFIGLFVGTLIFSLLFKLIEGFYHSSQVAQDHLSHFIPLSSSVIVSAIIIIALLVFTGAEKLEANHE